jgi:hypothetical protein
MQSPESPTEPIYGRRVEMPSGWKYKSFKLGPFNIPYYASPQSQLMLVSFVCFLCPGIFKQQTSFTRFLTMHRHVQCT